jgi:hypothetical protein
MKHVKHYKATIETCHKQHSHAIMVTFLAFMKHYYETMRHMKHMHAILRT